MRRHLLEGLIRPPLTEPAPASDDAATTELAAALDRAARRRLAEALASLKPGDVLVVWKLDRLGRSLKHLVETVAGLHERGIGLKVLTGGIDTTSAAGRLIFGIFAALAEFERELIRERTLAGLAAARLRGRHGGRRRKLTPTHLDYARRLLADPKASVGDVAAIFGVDRATLYRALER
jgi:DNA invertase Pin-like site-specific DNA recombinase